MSFDSLVVGTPLFEEVQEHGGPTTLQPTKKVDRIWKQEVVDAEGRRRFHGAFTGGFSAGYYNTVGSAEGWAPSEFKSSRSNRGKLPAGQQAEDFMDEEDLVAFGGKQLQTNSDYDFLGGTAAEIEKQRNALEKNSQSQIPGPAPAELVFATNDPIGKRLLKLMGWREGQGIGPRKKRPRTKTSDRHTDTKRRAERSSSSQPVTKSEATRSSDVAGPSTGAKRYGCPLPPGHDADPSRTKGHTSDEDNETDPYGLHFLYAPKNTAIFDPGSGKNNFYGLGFDPYKNAEEFRDIQSSNLRAIANGGGGAFGIGALEDDDDHEVYDNTDKSSYDFELVSEGPRNSERHGHLDRYGHGGRKTAEPDHDATGVQKCSDGLPPIAGFMVAVNENSDLRWFAPPTVPKDFVPFHRFDEDKAADAEKAKAAHDGKTTSFAPLNSMAPSVDSVENIKKSEGAGIKKNMRAAERGRLLGEPQVAAVTAVRKLPPGQLGRGPSLMSLSNPNLTEADRQRIAQTLAAGSRFVSASSVDEASAVDPLMDSTYKNDPPKQQRWVVYVTSKKRVAGLQMPGGVARAIESVQKEAGMTEWQCVQELKEFEEKWAESQSTAHGGVSPHSAAASTTVVRRSVAAWQPNRLLCKRFNVPDPYADRQADAPEKQRGTQELLQLPQNLLDITRAGSIEQGKDSSIHQVDKASRITPDSLYSEASGEINPEKGPEKPSTDLFKAIFEQSSSESEEDDQESADEVDSAATTGGRADDPMQQEDSLQDLFRDAGRFAPLPASNGRNINSASTGTTSSTTLQDRSITHERQQFRQSSQKSYGPALGRGRGRGMTVPAWMANPDQDGEFSKPAARALKLDQRDRSGGGRQAELPSGVSQNRENTLREHMLAQKRATDTVQGQAAPHAVPFTLFPEPAGTGGRDSQPSSTAQGSWLFRASAEPLPAAPTYNVPRPVAPVQGRNTEISSTVSSGEDQLVSEVDRKRKHKHRKKDSKHKKHKKKKKKKHGNKRKKGKHSSVSSSSSSST